MEEPILRYLNPKKPRVLFTDASKYAWPCVLIQSGEHIVDGRKIEILHPITYMSRLFYGRQINWATLTKEAYAIYMSISKTSL